MFYSRQLAGANLLMKKHKLSKLCRHQYRVLFSRYRTDSPLPPSKELIRHRNQAPVRKSKNKRRRTSSLQVLGRAKG
jgi:hypothetical protein